MRMQSIHVKAKVTAVAIGMIAVLSVHQSVVAEIADRQLTVEQARSFETFRKNDREGRRLPQLISDFAIQEGISADAIRNYLGKKGGMSADERKEYEKGSDFRALQRRTRQERRRVESEKKRKAWEAQRQKDQIEKERRTAARKRQHEELVNKATLEQITRILGDEGKARSFVSLRDNRMYGRKLTENELRFYGENAEKIAKMLEIRANYKPLHDNSAYKPDKEEQRVFDEAKKLDKRRKRR